MSFPTRCKAGSVSCMRERHEFALPLLGAPACVIFTERVAT